MNDIKFFCRVKEILHKIEESLEHQLDDQTDIDLQEESLQITLASGQVWLLNRHIPSQEIWLSSPLKGGLHFGWCAQHHQWISTRSTGDELCHFLEKDLSSALKFDVQI